MFPLYQTSGFCTYKNNLSSWDTIFYYRCVYNNNLFCNVFWGYVPFISCVCVYVFHPMLYYLQMLLLSVKHSLAVQSSLVLASICRWLIFVIGLDWHQVHCSKTLMYVTIWASCLLDWNLAKIKPNILWAFENILTRWVMRIYFYHIHFMNKNMWSCLLNFWNMSYSLYVN